MAKKKIEAKDGEQYLVVWDSCMGGGIRTDVTEWVEELRLFMSPSYDIYPDEVVIYWPLDDVIAAYKEKMGIE